MRFLSSIMAAGFVGAMALIGCQASPMAPAESPRLSIQVDDQPQRQTHHVQQPVTFGVRWPATKALTTQAIPDSARLIRFSVLTGSGKALEVDIIRDPDAATANKTIQLFPGEYSVIAKAFPDLQATDASPVLADGGASFSVTEGQNTAVSITLAPRPSPSPTIPPSSAPTPMASPTPSPSPSPHQPSPAPQASPMPSPSPSTTVPLRIVNITAKSLLDSSPVAGIRIAFLDISGNNAGSVTTGTDGKASITLPAVKTPPYWGAYYKVSVTLTSVSHFSVATIPSTGGINDLMVPPYGGVGDGSQPPGWACTVVIDTW